MHKKKVHPVSKRLYNIKLYNAQKAYILECIIHLNYKLSNSKNLECIGFKKDKCLHTFILLKIITVAKKH